MVEWNPMSQADANAKPPFQFQIRHLLWFTAWVAGLCGAAASWGLGGASGYIAFSLFAVGVVIRRYALCFASGAVILSAWLWLSGFTPYAREKFVPVRYM